jgi:DNA repair protein RadC
MNLEILIGKVAADKLKKSGINILQASEQDITYVAGKKVSEKLAAAKSLIMDIELPEKLTSSKSAYYHVKDMYQLDHEQFVVLALNRQNKVIDKIVISAGGLSGTVVDMKILFKRLILSGANGFIAAHNHPSGNLQPSDADIELTKKMIEAGKILDLRCFDHIIVAGLNYYSFADNGHF